jgi:hypothetical protein
VNGVDSQARTLSAPPSSKAGLDPGIYHQGEVERGGQSFRVPSRRVRVWPVCDEVQTFMALRKSCSILPEAMLSSTRLNST